MAFAVEPYIFDWIFFDDSSLSKLGGLDSLEGRQQDIHKRCIYSPLTLAQCVLIYHPAWVFVLLILMSGQPRP